MIYMTSVRDLTILLRQTLIAQSELDAKFVKNSLSRFGADLNKSNDHVIFDSISHDEVMIIYELSTRSSDSNVSMTLADESIEYYQCFSLKCIIYGSQSLAMSQKLISRFRSGKVRMNLLNAGCYIAEVSEPLSVNEFVNGSMWMRTDFDISLACKFKIQQLDEETEISELNSITTKEV